jgi:hypothetical protein
MFLGLFYQENVTYYSALLECVASWSEHSAFPLRGDYDRYRGTPTAELLRLESTLKEYDESSGVLAQCFFKNAELP